ncbi:MAG: EFR1 family ferrodoxin [Oscillospiraceae bacterium]|nr:EFR1 family ferrodoxin [Oscillospiraceae bacterium]
MQNVIYCFSGTGNSLAVARSVAGKLTDTSVVSVMALQDHAEVPASYERVGFVFPTCFGHPPKVVAELGESLRLHPHQKVFIIVTCGGADILTLSDFRRLLQPKTQNPIQGFVVRLPGNHIVGFSAWSEARQRRLFDNAALAIDQIVYQIKNDTPTKVKRDINLKLATFCSSTFNGWLGVKDIFSTKAEYFTTDACVHCGICEQLCPVGNIKASPTAVSFGDNCQQCMACIQWCPQRAVGHPNVPKDRKRYHHPDITVEDMLELLQAANQSV